MLIIEKKFIDLYKINLPSFLGEGGAIAVK